MKLNDIKTQEQLDEIKLKHILAGAALVGAMATSGSHKHEPIQKPIHSMSMAEKNKKEVEDLTKIVLSKYKIAPAKAKEIVTLAKKHEDKVFPKASDILAIIGIESSFNPNAKSNLKHDKAVGLTQVRPKVWGINASDLVGNMETQIKLGSDILNKYYHKLGKKDDAVHAYNIGLTNLRHDKNLNPSYVQKWKAELKRYEA